MRKAWIIIICCLFLQIPTYAQTEDFELERYLKRSEGIRYPNILKVNSLALTFQNISLSYERGIIPRLSFLISAGYKYQGKDPKLFSVNESDINASIDDIRGLSVTPELRYYLKTCNPRLLEGLYIGIYFRYTAYSSGVDFDYYPNGQMMELYRADASLSEVGGGLQLGYQLLLWERLSIDFMFFGPRFSNYNLIYEFDQNVSEQFLNDLSDYINDVIDRFGLDYEVELDVTGGTRASNSFSFASVRFGIGIGFAF